MPKFKNAAMQKMYETCRSGAAAATHKMYGGTAAAYWSGRAGHPSRFNRQSLAHAAWAAGRDDRKKGDRQ